MDDTTAEMCSADGQQFLRTACDPGALCLEGRCVGLDTPAGKLDRARLYTLRGEGWLNGWGGTEALSTKSFDKLKGNPEGVLAGENAIGLAPRCAAGGFVAALDKDKKRRGETRHALLAGYLVSGQRRPVTLLAGVRGGARIHVNGALALDARRPGGEAPFQDELVVDAELREGVNTVVVVVAQESPTPAGLWLRVRGRRGEALPDLLFAPASEEGCALGDLLDVRWSSRPVTEGFAVEAQVRVPGLWPRIRGELGYEARLDHRKAREETLGRGTLGAASLQGEGATLPFTARFAKAGQAELRLRLGTEGAPGSNAAEGSKDAGSSRNSRGGDAAEARRTLLFHGDLHDRVVSLEGVLSEATQGTLPAGSRDSFAHHVATLQRALTDGPDDVSWLRATLKEAEEIAGELRQGRDPYRTRTGVVHRAYRSTIDGALQPYPVFVPPSYRPDGPPLPLVIVAHGLDNPPEVALRTAIGEAPDMSGDRERAARHLPSFPDQGAILAAPWGFGNAGPRLLGEHDTLAVIEALEAHYRVDPRRVSLTGYSLGGTVAFTVPLHHPDRFSASAPLCGYPNLKDYRSIRGVRHAPWEDRLIEQRYTVRYAENGLHLPLHVVHGGKDGPERSKVVVERYRALGYKVDFDLQEDLDHNVWDHGYEHGRMIAWLIARRRPEAPSRARLVTGEHRYDRAYWVRLLRRQDGAARGEIDGRWAKEERRVEVTTRNVEALALDFTGMGAAGGGTARVVLDREAPIEVPEPAGEVFFVRQGGAWTRATEAPSTAHRKRPGVAGPLDDVLRHPQLIVYGTLDPAQADVNRQVAEYHRGPATGAEVRIPMKADTEVSEAELTGRSLVLVGGPASNRVTALFARDLPVKFEEGALTLRGKRHEGDHVGVSLIWPHPRDPAEYLVVHAGVTFRGTLYSRHLPRLVPDFVVYDARITTQKGEMLMDLRPALDGGFFGEAWD
ncbi:Hypothetical protein CAP_8242 [Chondromyces apiculatus DSM 436]|uniref:Peptidase S9 prolyl oligopeptidase catalytic domain-containing protein n=1 Tax=Chondromyces apiculatus DSM 436 TaxID=1192034 RepID=A0A017TGL2_9BACT|nr:Hypothetical protein CAP_8242 [Chondromyces apiculatus DSM 436]